MGILDGIVEWIAEQVMAGLDLVTTSVLGALGCDIFILQECPYLHFHQALFAELLETSVGFNLFNS